VDRKKCLEEDFTETSQPQREVPSQARTVDLFDATPMFKAQDLQHCSCFPFNDSANEPPLSYLVREELHENMTVVEDDEMDLL
jgi:hypothetical protein